MTFSELEAKAWENPDYLIRYFEELIVKSIKEDLNEMDEMFTKLYNLCKKWEHLDPLYHGIGQYTLAFQNYFMGDFAAAEKYADTAYHIFKKLGQSDYAGMALMVQGGALRSLGKLDQAVKLLYLGTEEANPDNHLAVFLTYCYYHLAEIFSLTRDFESARQAYEMALKFAVEHNNSNGVFRSYNGLGNLYVEYGDLKKGKEYYDKSLVANKMSDPQISRAYCDLGIYYLKAGDYNQSEEYLMKSYTIRMDKGMQDAASTSLIELGHLRIEQGLIEEATDYLEQALEITFKTNSRGKQLKCYKLLAKVYKISGKTEQSLDAFEKYDALQQDFHSVTLKNIYAIKNQKIEEQKEVISRALDDIKASINYAKRIQKAILPPMELIQQHLPVSYIYYRPKDIVAGDFYWFEHIEDSVIFAVADCTGHGVPGAMVSVVCHNALNRAVREYDLKNPAAILDKVNELVQDSLSKTEETEVKDGMDIAICTYNPKDKKLTFAGANNPLYFISHTENSHLHEISHQRKLHFEDKTFFEIKGTKQPIGKYALSRSFEEVTLSIASGDQIILSSDGYPDQFGGDDGGKLMYKPFKNMLLQNTFQPFEQQQKALESNLVKWMGTYEQTDDVCVMSVVF